MTTIKYVTLLTTAFSENMQFTKVTQVQTLQTKVFFLKQIDLTGLKTHKQFDFQYQWGPSLMLKWETFWPLL